MKVLVSDSIAPQGVDVMRKAGLTVDVKTGMSPDELIACIGEYHGLVVRSATKATAEVIAAAKNLKVIGRAGSGLDNVDRNAASQKGIVVMNTPGGNTVTTAEHTIAMMISLARSIPQATASMKAGKWEKKKFMGVELYNKTLGIIGLGAIGTQVAKKAQGLEMNVIAFDPFLSDEKAKALGIEKADLPTIYKRADFISIHTPKTPETANLINKETIAMMKSGVRILNCARGGIINETDLHAALVSGKVAGAALDVFNVEPPKDNPLLELDSVICTPHLGASTEEAQINVAVAVAEQLVDYLVHGTIRNAVNFPSIPADQVNRLRPYINLAERLGAFVSQAFEGGAESISIEYMGSAAEINTAPVTIAAIKGFLTPILEDSVNFVNAPFIAKDRGISVNEATRPDAGDYRSLVAITVSSAKNQMRVTGTLFGKQDPRIVSIDNYPTDISPVGELLFAYNNDKPGVIGSIGMALAESGINIARMHFGREAAGGGAISVVSVDAPPSAEVIDKIKALPNILSVKLIAIP
ncbi:MAG: phosphoglycerate dehydrogenase [Nitrospirae bacterium]|nr:phosphoglycerate dehydrogenase [Nitrospirota bacterium]